MDQEVTTTHICLLNGDFTSILTPIIDSTIPSEKLVIVSTDEFYEQANKVINIAKTRGYKAKWWRLPDSNNCFDLKLAFLEIFEKYRVADNELCLNASNGTRSQALSAFEVAREYNAGIYVVESQNDQLFWLYPDDRPPTPIQDKLKVHEYFELIGANLESQKKQHGVDKSIRLLGAKWVSQVNTAGNALAKLNYLAATANYQHESQPMNKSMLNDEILWDLLNDLIDIDLISVNNNIISFKSEETRFFCNGGWLEEYAYGIVKSLRPSIPTIQDQAHSAVVARQIDGKTVRNELDVIALVNNKLHLMECKTKRFKGTSGSDTLYKIDSLNDLLGGIRGRAALLTYQSISSAEKARAAELDIAIFCKGTLTTLKSHLAAWLSKS